MSILERLRRERSATSLRHLPFSKQSITSINVLRDTARQTAVLKPGIPNFVSLPWANKAEELNTEFQTRAAKVVAEAFGDKEIDAVLGIGNSGLPFSKAVQQALKPYAVARNRRIGHGEIHNLGKAVNYGASTGTIFTAHSYSRQANVSFYIPEVKAGTRVLIVDDVSAQGSIGIALVQELQNLGVEVVGFGVYFNKEWQGGLRKLTEKTGVPSFSVIRIDNVKDGKIRLSSKDTAFARYEPNAVA